MSRSFVGIVTTAGAAAVMLLSSPAMAAHPSQPPVNSGYGRSVQREHASRGHSGGVSVRIEVGGGHGHRAARPPAHGHRPVHVPPPHRERGGHDGGHGGGHRGGGGHR